ALLRADSKSFPRTERQSASIRASSSLLVSRSFTINFGSADNCGGLSRCARRVLVALPQNPSWDSLPPLPAEGTSNGSLRCMGLRTQCAWGPTDHMDL